MPLETRYMTEAEEAENQSTTAEDDAVELDVLALLFEEDGSLTFEGQVIADFLEFVDWSPVLEAILQTLPEEEIDQSIAAVEGYARDDDGRWVECNEDDEGAEPVLFLQAHPETLLETLGEEGWVDLVGMFDHYVENLPESTLNERARKRAIEAWLQVERLSEEDEEAAWDALEPLLEAKPSRIWKRGDFSKMRNGKPPSTAAGKKAFKNYKNPVKLVQRMLGAMIDKVVTKNKAFAGKGAISRVDDPEDGYKASGSVGPATYKRAPGGYATGTAGGVAKYRKYAKKKKQALAKKKKQLTKGKGGEEKPKKVKKGSGTRKITAKAAVGGSPKAPKRAPAKLAASEEGAAATMTEDTTPEVRPVSMSALAGKATGLMESKLDPNRPKAVEPIQNAYTPKAQTEPGDDTEDEPETEV